jgi:hypothetical protein
MKTQTESNRNINQPSLTDNVKRDDLVLGREFPRPPCDPVSVSKLRVSGGGALRGLLL